MIPGNVATIFNKVHSITARAGARYMYEKTEQDLGLGFNSAIDELVSVGNGVNGLRRIGGEHRPVKMAKHLL